MDRRYQLREVFSRGMPTVTYVDREHLDLERKLKGAVAKGHAIIAITGPSKCGKTVLRKRVIPDSEAVRVEGGQVVTESDFWATIQTQLDLPATRTETASKQVTGSTGWGGSLGPSWARLSGNFADGSASTRGASHTFSGAEKSHLLSELLASRKVLVIDDFHYVKAEIRASIVRGLKAPVFDGLPVVMLSVPYRAFDVLTAEAEMEGRFTHLTIPAWSVDDLSMIADLGFPAMGVRLRPAAISEGEDPLEFLLADESMGSPLLMQSLCAELCNQLDVLETAVPPKWTSTSEIALPSIFRRIASDFGLPAFEKLSKGPQRKADRIPRQFANYTTGDIYEAVLAAVAYAGAPERITYEELRAALRNILSDDIPQKHEITRSVTHMCAIARGMQIENIEQREGEKPSDDGRLEIPALDWKDDVLYLNDVFLRFYLRWVHRDKIDPGNDSEIPF